MLEVATQAVDIDAAGAKHGLGVLVVDQGQQQVLQRRVLVVALVAEDRDGKTISLPRNRDTALRVIAAYWRCVTEDLGPSYAQAETCVVPESVPFSDEDTEAGGIRRGNV